MQPNNTTQFDPSVVALMHGLKMQEGGGTINYNAIGDGGTAAGAGQWSNQINGKPTKLSPGQIPANFIGAAKTYGLNPNDFSPDNQNKVLYQEILAKKQQNLTPEQILSAHNSGDPNAYLKGNTGYNSDIGSSYNTGQYVKQAMAYAQSYVAKNNAGQSGGNGIIPTANASTGGITPAAPQIPQQPSVGGFLGNVVSSGANILGGLGNMVMHPIDTATNLLSTVAGAGESATNALGLTNINNQDTQNFGHVVDYFGNRYGGNSPSDIVHNIGHTLYTDPVGAALDLSMFLDAGSSAVAKLGKISDIAEATKLSQASDFISSTAGMIKGGTPEAIKALQTPGTLTKIADAMGTIGDYTNPITGVVKATTGTLGLAGKVGLGLGSKIIGEPAETLIDLVKNPQDYSKAAIEATSSGGLANEFGKAIDTVENTKSTTGVEYKAIRDAKTPVTISSDSIIQAFADNGLNVSKDATGKWTIASPDANTTLSPADVTHFKQFLDQYGNEKLNSSQFLNARSKLSEFSNYDGKTSGSTQLARDLRGAYDQIGKQQIPGLKELDAKMAPQLQAWKGIKKEFLTKDATTGKWTIKPNTASKLANAMKAGKEPLLAQMEKILPGITRKIEVLKNIENIESKMGITVGSYTKSGLEIAGVAMGNIPLAVGMIIAHPAIANQILRGLGFVGKVAVMPVLGRVRALLGLLPEGTIMNASKLGVINNKATENKPPQK